ncbi:MAG TPA: leucine--tRNA ligase [Bacteroidales bacterium]|nr:leucine--tRNA ligase [Bacteroidales bacterium]HPS73031.1 leucine--tRNA ligase [Bacteroidales bacterium]
MEYNFTETERKWQEYWQKNKTFHAVIDHSKPKFYVLDMFPYPSGAGLHVGHPLGYIASDIYARYKMLKGFNVLHPMGYDAYGLPAEQYAIQTGTHPAVTTEKNVARYREQMDKIGFCFDWDREVKTCDPEYYKWTQWTFIQLFQHWYDPEQDKARPITDLVRRFETEDPAWKGYSEKERQDILMNYRLAYLSEAMVNWCPGLGTVLANDEVANGYSVRGGHPVERKMMRQWFLRISAYAQRLLDGLNDIEWSDSLKEIQRNWIGRSEGAEVLFPIKDSSLSLEIFTTRPDTIFGSTFMVLAPEHPWISQITTPDREAEVNEYVNTAINRSERERMAEVKKVTGAFTGAYCVNPLNGQPVPIWVADYVLSGYGTGAIMAVPAHDSRDYEFAKHFGLPIIEVVSGGDISESSYDAKDGILVNSGFLNGMKVKEAISAMIRRIEEMGIGTGKINFRLRDAIFSRQRYWGEPFPVYYKDGIPMMLDESELPLLLPPVDAYLPTETGDPPLARAKNWKTKEGYPLETNTMPGFAGSSGYYLRYMDPRNNQEYFSKEAVEYWQNVDLYIGGDEHATGHLLYARFWNKFLFDMGMTVRQEPFHKLINQGKIQGRSSFVYRVAGTNKFVSFNLKDDYETAPMHVDISLVNNDVLDTEGFRKWRPDLAEAEFILENGKYICGFAIEKMSKSLYNVINPDDLIAEYGADTLRLYEMFLGPLEQSKPWDTNGVEGVFRFIRKFWRLFHDAGTTFCVTDEEPTPEELRVLHKTIKKVQEDIERFSFNTVVSTFMICANELSDLKCSKRAILEPLVILISPYAPHLAEELWQKLGHEPSVSKASFPEFNEKYLVENTFNYPVSFNGKMRFMMTFPLDMPVPEIEKAVLAAPESQKWLQGHAPKKMIVVPKKIVNVVI